MKKYRIVKKHYDDGKEYFIVQKKNLFGVWGVPKYNNLLNDVSFSMTMTTAYMVSKKFKTFDLAKEALDLTTHSKMDEVVYETTTLK